MSFLSNAKILNKIFYDPENIINTTYKSSGKVLNLTYNPTEETLNVNINNLYSTINSIYNKYVFRETFTGDGVSNQFQLIGNIGNGVWTAGTWNSSQIQLTLPQDITRTDYGTLYDSTNIITRHSISVSSTTSTGLVTTNYIPRSGQSFFIWYWYRLTDGDLILDYIRED